MIAKKLDYSLSGFIPLIYDPSVWRVDDGDWFVTTWYQGVGYIGTAKYLIQ